MRGNYEHYVNKCVGGTCSRRYIRPFLRLNSVIEIYYPDSLCNQEAKTCYSHRSLHAFVLVKDGMQGIIYVGKSEGDVRLRQYLTSEKRRYHSG